MTKKLLISIALGALVCMALFVGSPVLFADAASKDAPKAVGKSVVAAATDASKAKSDEAAVEDDDKIEKEIEKAIKEDDAKADQEWEAKGPHGKKKWWHRHRRCKKCIWWCKHRFDWSHRHARKCIRRHCSFYCDWYW